jgi:CBS domain-containing protein
MKKVREFMNPNVIFFNPDESIFDAAKIFSEKNISGAPVVNKEKVIGVISESNIVKFMRIKLGKGFATASMSLLIFSFLRDYARNKNILEEISKIRVKDVMSRKVVSISPEASLYEAAAVMERKDVNRLPVIENKKLIGIIARADLIKALIQ